jgi:hypothetical protein
VNSETAESFEAVPAREIRRMQSPDRKSVRSRDGLLLQPHLERARLHGNRERHMAPATGDDFVFRSPRLTER